MSRSPEAGTLTTYYLLSLIAGIGVMLVALDAATREWLSLAAAGFTAAGGLLLLISAYVFYRRMKSSQESWDDAGQCYPFVSLALKLDEWRRTLTPKEIELWTDNGIFNDDSDYQFDLWRDRIDRYGQSIETDKGRLRIAEYMLRTYPEEMPQVSAKELAEILERWRQWVYQKVRRYNQIRPWKPDGREQAIDRPDFWNLNSSWVRMAVDWYIEKEKNWPEEKILEYVKARLGHYLGPKFSNLEKVRQEYENHPLTNNHTLQHFVIVNYRGDLLPRKYRSQKNGPAGRQEEINELTAIVHEWHYHKLELLKLAERLAHEGGFGPEDDLDKAGPPSLEDLERVESMRDRAFEEIRTKYEANQSLEDVRPFYEERMKGLESSYRKVGKIWEPPRLEEVLGLQDGAQPIPPSEDRDSLVESMQEGAQIYELKTARENLWKTLADIQKYIAEPEVVKTLARVQLEDTKDRLSRRVDRQDLAYMVENTSTGICNHLKRQFETGVAKDELYRRYDLVRQVYLEPLADLLNISLELQPLEEFLDVEAEA